MVLLALQMSDLKTLLQEAKQGDTISGSDGIAQSRVVETWRAQVGWPMDWQWNLFSQLYMTFCRLHIQQMNMTFLGISPK